ncbi:hypothetical protein HDN1F_06030 [gamma proteobacterium HdN1]|nr:hypothetical protein HDN1F_06030 [gamma proteobacterium HdN1]
MSGIQRRQLTNGTDVIWAVPLSGMGHTADEQPLPYLHWRGEELTPRYGGEESLPGSSIKSLPLPYGFLASTWPWRQRIFNLPRRRINIYWRNIFRDATRKDRLFHFIEQLKYSETEEGFIGNSPSLSYQRTFTLEENLIIVNDTIIFKDRLHFSELYLCPWADFQNDHHGPRCRIQPSLTPNHSNPIKSSTGSAQWHAHKLLNVEYDKGDQVGWNYTYSIE